MTSHSKKKKHKFGKIFLIILIVALIVGAMYVIGNKKEPIEEKVETSNENETKNESEEIKVEERKPEKEYPEELFSRVLRKSRKRFS